MEIEVNGIRQELTSFVEAKFDPTFGWEDGAEGVFQSLVYSYAKLINTLADKGVLDNVDLQDILGEGAFIRTLHTHQSP